MSLWCWNHRSDSNVNFRHVYTSARNPHFTSVLYLSAFASQLLLELSEVLGHVQMGNTSLSPFASWPLLKKKISCALLWQNAEGWDRKWSGCGSKIFLGVLS